MASNEKFSRTVEYKGIADFSQIIASFNKLKTSLRGRGTSEADILNLDAEIKKVAELDKAIQKAIQKGFKTPKEFSDFTKLTSQASKSIAKLSQEFKKVDATTITESLKNAQNQIKILQQSAERFNNAYLKSLNSVLKESKNRDEINQKIKEELNNISKGADAELKIEKILQDELTIQENQLNKSRDSLAQEQKKLETLEKEKTALENLSNFNAFSNGKNFRSNFLQTGNYTNLQGEAIDATRMNDIQTALTKAMSNNKSSVKQLVKILEELGLKLKNAEDKTALFNEASRRFKEQMAQQNNAIKEANNNIKQQKEDVEQLENAYNKLKSGFGTGANAGKGSLVTDFNEAAGIAKKIADATAREQELLNRQATPISGLQENIELQNRFNEAIEIGNEDTQQAIKSQSELDSTFDQLSNRLKYMLSFMNAYYVSMRAIKQTFNDIRNIDKAFASIAMVTDMTVSELWGQYDDYAKIANELGQSTESVIKSSALYYQQGLNTAQALTLTKDTMKLATLANIDFEQSTKLMTAALRAFHMELDSGAHITDVYSELAANAAANVQDIAYAMSKTASISASAGMSFENTAAMLTTMIEVTQEAPENLGTAMKSIVARFTEVKKNVSDIEGDIEDMDINKVDAALKSVGISLKDQAGQLRDLDQVFLELSAEWNDLDRNTQRYIATLAAGSRQQSRFLALMENYDRTMELIETAQDSAGRSSEQFAKYADSVENKVNKLKNTWEQFRVNLIDEKTVKKFLDTVNQALAKFSKINLSQILGIGVWGLTIGKSFIQGIIKGLRQSSNLLATAVENLKAKITTGSTKIQLQTNLNEINTQIDQLKIKLSEISFDKNVSWISDFSGTINDIGQLETELNKLGLTIDGTRTDLEFLDFTTDNYENSLKLLVTEGKLTEQEMEALSRVLKNNKDALLQANNGAVELRQKLNQLGTEATNTARNLQSAKNWGIAGNAIGSALGTAAMMAFTGTFGADQIAKTVSIQLLSTGVMTAINATTAAMGRSAGMTFGAAFTQASGWIGLLLASLSALYLAVSPIIKEWVEDWKYHHDLVYKAKKDYEAVVEESKKLSEQLDEQNQKLEAIEDKQKNVSSASNTFEELNRKISLSEEEQQKLNEAIQTLAEEMPSLVSYYDAEGNAVIEINESYKEKIKLLKQEVIEQEKIAALTNTQLQNSKYAESKLGINIVEQFLSTEKIASIWGEEKDQQTGQRIDKVYTTQEILNNFEKFNWEQQTVQEGDFTEIFNEAMAKAVSLIKEKQYDVDVAQREVWIGLTEEERKKAKEYFLTEYISKLAEAGAFSEESGQAYLNKDKELQERISAEVEALQTNYNTAIKEALLKVDDSERKKLIESVLKNIYLNPEDIKKAYEDALANDENGELNQSEMDALLNSLIKPEEIDKTIKEIENLTPKLYETVTNFYNELSALSQEERYKAIMAVEPSAEKVAADMRKQNWEIQKNIRQMTQKYIDNYGITDLSQINNLKKNSEIVIENVLEKASEIADKYGSNNGERYITAFNEAVATGSLNEAAKTYLNSIDWSTFDFIHEEEQKEQIVNTLVETYKVAENEARKIVNNFLNTAGKENIGFVVELRTEADVVAIQQSAEKAYEILQDSMDSFTVLYNLEPNQDSVELTREQYEKVANAIKQLNEAEDSPYHINLSDYLGIDGKTFSNIAKFKEELQAPLKGTIELNAKLTELQQKRESGTLTDAEKGMLEALEIAVPSLRNMNLYMSEFAENAKEAVTTFKDIANSIGSIASDYQSITEEQEENGFLSSSALKGLTENINSLNEQLSNTSLKGQQLDITSILSRNEKGYYANTEALKAYIIHLIAAARASGDFNVELQRELQSILDDINAYDLKRLEEAQKAAEEEREKRLEELKKAAEEAQKAEEDAQKAAEDAAEDAQKAQEEIAKAEDALKSAQDKVKEIYKDIEEKQQKVIEQQEKLNELMYGTGSSRKSTLDGMYNYDQLLKQIENDLENVNAILEHPASTDDIGGAVAQYGQLIHSKKVNLLSQQSIYQQSLASAKSILNEYSAYYAEINGRLLVDVAKLNSAAMPDKVKDQIESTISAYNDSVDKIHEITSQIKQLENEFLNFQRTYRDKYINLQEKVIETLKSQAQEELNTTKEKYSALEEADNDYITALEEAIKKQRELRQQEQDINELSQKEKKLSLLQRDTSGTRKKDVQKQQKEIEKARQSITDKSVDNLINSLKELYKDQKESRDAETKYMETVLENATYIEEANAVISSWQTADDMIAWFFDHSTEVNEMTQEQLEQYSEELEEMYNAREIYMNTSMEDFTKMLEVQEEEIVNTTTETAEHLTSEAQRAFAEVMKEVDKAISEAKKDLADAMAAVDEAKQQLLDALNEVTGKLKDVETAKINAANAAKLQAQAEKDLADAIEKRKAAEAIVVEEEQKPITTTTTTNTGSGSSGSNSYQTINNNVNNAVNQAAEVIATVPTTGTGTNAVAKNSVEVDKLIDNFNKMDKDQSQSYTISKHIPDGWETKEYLSYIKKGLKDPLMLTVDNTNKPTKFKVFNSSTNAYSSGGVNDWRIYKKGGLVNYTGPAWVDGTPANPEAFLSTEDTKNIARLTDVLGSLYSSLNNFNTPSAAISNNNTVINVSVNVDGISSDYDVDRAVEKVKQSIVDAANQVGSTVILYQ